MSATSIAIPSHMRFGLRPPGPKVRSYTSVFTSQNSSYSCSQSSSARIDIPALGSSVIDTQQSALRLRATVTVADAQLDFTAASLIRSIQVYSQGQGNLLESIDNYGLLNNLLYSVVGDMQSCEYGLSVLVGHSETQPRQGAVITAGTSREFYLPMTSILGLFSERVLPAVGYTLVIQFQDTNIAVRASAQPTIVIDNLAYVASIHDLGADLYSALTMSSGGTVLIPATSYRSFEASTTTSSSQSIQVGVRASSIKGFIGCFRRSDTLTLPTSRSLSDTQSGGTLSSYQFRLGSELKPATPPQSYAAFFYELQKAYHALSTNVPGMIDYTGFTRNAAWSTDTLNAFGAFALGLDLEEAARHKTDSSLSGYNNTSGQNVFVDFTWGNAVASSFNIFAHIDTVLSVTGQNTVVAQF